MQSPNRSSLVASFGLLVLGVAGCSRGGGGAGIRSDTFRVLANEPAHQGIAFLNDPIRIDFSNAIDVATVGFDALGFGVFDRFGERLGEVPAGELRVTASPGDSVPGRRLEFVPRLPTNDTFDDGGLRPGRRYVVQIGDSLRDVHGQSVAVPVSFEFGAVDGTLAGELFRDTKAGGPRRTSFEVTATDAQGTALSLGGRVAVEIRLGFDQPLNPSRANVPHLGLDPTRRTAVGRGRVFLEYDDPDPALGANTWIPAEVDLERNGLAGSEIVLRPIGVLPNNAAIRVIVEAALEDLAGESNVGDATYDRTFAGFHTRAAYEPQFDAVVETFLDARRIDLQAPQVEPLADLTDGRARAGLAFPGKPTPLRYEPDTTEVVLNTDFTQIKPSNGPALNVSGGVFEFASVHIRKGTTVRGIGSRPMVWIVNERFVVDGTIDVRGGNGITYDGFYSDAAIPTPGGIGTCGGGSGGRGSPNTTAESFRGESGFGPGRVAGGGGEAGYASLLNSCDRGSGGGGGSFATQGDPWFTVKADGRCFRQQLGVGGAGCRGDCYAPSRSLDGGRPGASPFTDPRVDNDFWGAGVDLHRWLRITGELATPIGGQGGGGGGDRYTPSNRGANWRYGNKGGGGGAGGGVLIIQCLGEIEVTESGSLRADGGHGGGGETAGGNQSSAGGGGGSGGMIVLMAGERIVLHTHGGTYADGDYDFALSADGGVGTQGSFGGRPWRSKYPPLDKREDYDANPCGGWGGLGLIQLMAPPGDGTGDGTNTRLDDNIVIVDDGTPLQGAEKMRYLAWRGFRDGEHRLDDDGNEVAIGDAEGDLRPSPTLLPAPFGHLSRLRSLWIDTGASVRRPLTAADGLPRGVVEDHDATPPLLAGPDWFFAATSVGSTTKNGYIEYDPQAAPNFPLVPLPAPPQVRTIEACQDVDGVAAYRIELDAPSLGSITDRYAQYRAELVAGAAVAGSYRILSHDDRRLLVAADAPLPVLDSLHLRIRAQFFDIAVDDQPGLGPTYVHDGERVPQANVRIGFAFHRDATKIVVDQEGFDDNRFPKQVRQFTHDLNSPAAREALRLGGFRYVQWDLLFNTRFSPDAPHNTDPLRPLTITNPRPSLDNLVIPYRF